MTGLMAVFSDCLPLQVFPQLGSVADIALLLNAQKRIKGSSRLEAQEDEEFKIIAFVPKSLRGRCLAGPCDQLQLTTDVRVG